MAKLSAYQKLRRGAVRLRYGGYDHYPLLDDVPDHFRRTVMERHYFDSRWRYFYARVPKAANSTIVATLRDHAGQPPADDMDVAKREMNTAPFMGEYRKAFRFTFTRDPARRVLSSYLDKLVSEKRFLHHFKDRQVPSFLTFLNMLEDRDFFADAHFIPQHMIVPFAGRDMDIIARTEALEEGLARVCQQVFGRFGGVTQHAAHATRANTRVDEHFNPATRALIYRLYQRDYDMFGYEPDL